MFQLVGSGAPPTLALKVLNVGCGAGTECRVLGRTRTQRDGNRYQRASYRDRAQAGREMGFKISFDVGSAIALPYESSVFDVCLIPQLLEHVPDWQKCLDEGVRVLRPGGLIYLSTTNVLCPIQDEFELPLYSWYPSFVKRRCEKLAVTTHPEWVSRTDYPAVHWFTFWELRDFLAKKDIKCFDRFDLAEVNGISAARGLAIKLIRRVPPIRVAAYFVVLGTILVGAEGSGSRIKNSRTRGHRRRAAHSLRSYWLFRSSWGRASRANAGARISSRFVSRERTFRRGNRRPA